MDLNIVCPKCGSRINVSQQIEDLVAARSQAEASRLVKAQLPRAVAEAEEKGRREERRKSKQALVQRDQKNKALLKRVAALTHRLDRKDQAIEAKAESLGLEHAQRAIAAHKKQHEGERLREGSPHRRP